MPITDVILIQGDKKPIEDTLKRYLINFNKNYIEVIPPNKDYSKYTITLYFSNTFEANKRFNQLKNCSITTTMITHIKNQTIKQQKIPNFTHK